MTAIQSSLALLLLLFVVVTTTTTTFAFVIPTTHHTRNTATTLFIDKRIADMIDQEYYREQHKKEFEKEWMQENKKILTYHMTKTVEESVVGFSQYINGDDEDNFRSRAKDRIMAQQNPQMYCLDRCLATGNCDIFEELFQFSPYEVMDFCKECVLSEEDLCDVPDTFYRDGNDDGDLSKLRP